MIDLEGPRGVAVAPGPWPVGVQTEGPEPRLEVVIDGVVSAVPLSDEGLGRYVGLLPDAPLGARFTYQALLDDSAEPPSPRGVEVVAEAPLSDAGVVAQPCTMSFQRPLEGAVLGADDDSAPQAGLQLRVVVETNLPAGTPARLLVDGERGYAGLAGAGVVAFVNVDVEEGEHRLLADAWPAGGRRCGVGITLRVE